LDIIVFKITESSPYKPKFIIKFPFLLRTSPSTLWLQMMGWSWMSLLS